MHHVVVLENYFPLTDFTFEHTTDIHQSTKADEVASRVQDATIILCAASTLSYDTITKHAPKLQLIAVMGTGYDKIDQTACREREITLCHVPAQNTDAVAEHAFALYFAAKRRIVSLHETVRDKDVWAAGSGGFMWQPVPKTCGEETLGIVGYGQLGKKVETIAKALGMTVHIAERKGASQVRDGRMAFDTALKECTAFICVTPLDDSTRNMIDSAELAAMKPGAVVINTGRGGVINESALAQALKDHQIGAAGTDVFEHEPATRENCPLLEPDVPNITYTPHIAWYAQKTVHGSIRVLRENVEYWAAGKPQNVVLQGKPAEGVSKRQSEGS